MEKELDLSGIRDDSLCLEREVILTQLLSLFRNLIGLGILAAICAITAGGCSTQAKSISQADVTVTESPVQPLPSDNGISEPSDTEEQDDEAVLDPFATSEAEEVEEYDPLESYNVLVFEFNYKLDHYVIKPVATGYNFVVPDLVQQGIKNVIQNVRVVPRLFNNVFQAKFKGAGIELTRFLVNSTVGIAGFFDPAKGWLNLETPPEDTGQTLGVYGTPPGPYLVMPFLGSFTLRDGVGYVADLFLDPFNWLVLPIIQINDAPILVRDNTSIAIGQFAYRSVEMVNFRSLNLERFQGVEEGTVDLYGAVRNAYLQSRAKAIKE